MERYVDGFVIPIPNEKLDAYRDMADEAGKLWIEHGALEYFEGAGDDMEPDMDGMPMATFPQLAETGDDETVLFSFIVFESRDHRDEVNAKVMEDPAMDPDNFDGEMPFDMERMSYGGSVPSSVTKIDERAQRPAQAARNTEGNVGCSQIDAGKLGR